MHDFAGPCYRAMGCALASGPTTARLHPPGARPTGVVGSALPDHLPVR
jgi:hypothetical protein